MDLLEIFVAQVTDLFRIGLIVALLATQTRTAAVTGRALPLALGVVFVAVMIPLTLPSSGAEKLPAIAVGLASNALILALAMAGWALIGRFRPKG